MTVPGAAEPGRPRGPRVLVTAASMHGSTAEIAQAIAEVLAARGMAVTVLAPDAVESVQDYDAVIIGSAVYVGHWLGPARDLVDAWRDQLRTRPVWLFSSGPVGSPVSRLAQGMAKDPAELPGLRAATGAREHRIFAGRLDRRRLSPAQRASLLIFRGLEGDFRDWSDVRQWADGIAGQLTTAAAA